MMIYNNYEKSQKYLNDNIKNIKKITIDYNDVYIVFQNGDTFNINYDECELFLNIKAE